MKRWLWLLGLFLVLVVFLGVGLTLDPREVPSPLIGKAAPAFQLPQLHEPEKMFSQKDLAGKVWLLNVWGSWCVSCQVEHPTLIALAKMNVVPIIGFDWKDKPEAALKWLAAHGGDPYTLSVTDLDGRVAIDYGVYGVPETYVIDRRGLIRYKHIGPLTPEVARDKLAPLLQELSRES